MIEIFAFIFVVIMCFFLIILIIKIIRAEQKITDISNNFSSITKNIQDFYSKNISFITQTSHDNQNLIEMVNQKVLRLEQTNSKILSIVDTIQKLEDVFLNSKKRGIWGEKNLEVLISVIFCLIINFSPSTKQKADTLLILLYFLKIMFYRLMRNFHLKIILLMILGLIMI